MRLRRGEYILVEGPARVSGKIDVFGCECREIVVRAGKAYPIRAIDDSEIEITPNSRVRKIDDPFVEWREILNLCENKKRIIVLGPTDSGKTTLVHFLANHLHPRYVIDADIGQADIGPPTVISVGFVTRPVRELSELRPIWNYFTGIVNIVDNIDSYLKGLKISSKKFPRSIIDTTGFVEEWFINEELDRVKPDLAICINLNPSIDVEKITLSPIEGIKKKERSERIFLRRSAFLRYLRGAELRVIPDSGFRKGQIVGLFKGKTFKDIGLVRELNPTRILTHVKEFDRIKKGKTFINI
ncbi:MAG: hypothetical protein DRO94_01670 [Candidatus Altiarchaeales archaeon]|nr:MAG: hypothetical protein DRO94_01670 [Candidatus Altiarchaeales archaeon]